MTEEETPVTEVLFEMLEKAFSGIIVEHKAAGCFLSIFELEGFHFSIWLPFFIDKIEL